MAKESRNHKERRHPEDMDGKERYGERHAGMTVADDPDSRRRRNEGEGRVQDDPEQQRERPDGVQRMQPIRRGGGVVKLRHGVLVLSTGRRREAGGSSAGSSGRLPGAASPRSLVTEFG